jgi:hypothetical protein
MRLASGIGDDLQLCTELDRDHLDLVPPRVWLYANSIPASVVDSGPMVSRYEYR